MTDSLALARFINHPSGFLALSEQNMRFEQVGLDGFISYRIKGSHWVALGGVHGGKDNTPLLQAFLDAAQHARKRCVFIQVPKHQVALFEAKGATVNRLGSTFAISLSGYTLKGMPKMALRNKIKRAKATGLAVREVKSTDSDAFMLKTQIHAISEAWLKKKRKKELDFMIGVLNDENDAHRRVFVAVDVAGQVQAFITYVPVWGEQPGYLHDLSRRLPEAPAGAMELINAFAIQHMQDEKTAWLHFGFTPFIATGEEPQSASRIMSKLSVLLYRFGSFIYSAKSQADYKRKWGTDSVMPEYIAGFPLSLSAVLALLLLTRAL